ncbi:hypothetical protein [Micromonospora sp. WMMD964]|uniref:DUF4760 domain-containing protein n=1 Tax=Micromonospora sp. WMMD964 TaxID=3016091 RepID=UPI00249CDFAE|nr:hypothetical protein [Micromonospora sp. WMMD964]WFF00196.1 hypothetical protein O7616_25380 [Micromonospora sp. WMMD964]
MEEPVQVSWDAISAISDALAAAIVIVAAWIALRQFKESLSARQLQGILGLMQQLESSSARRSRSFLYRHRDEVEAILGRKNGLRELDEFLRKTGPADDGPHTLSELRKDLATLEYAALLAVHGMIPATLEQAYFVPTVVDYWLVMEPVVRATRKEIGSDVYLQHFESIYRLATTGQIHMKNASFAKAREARRLVAQSRAMVLKRTEGSDAVPW